MKTRTYNHENKPETNAFLTLAREAIDSHKLGDRRAAQQLGLAALRRTYRLCIYEDVTTATYERFWRLLDAII